MGAKSLFILAFILATITNLSFVKVCKNLNEHAGSHEL